MHRPRSVRDADVAGKRVLVRADLNVPLEDGRVADDTRIRAALPTLRLLLERGAAEVVVCSHLGRPKGPDPAYAIAPVAERLRELLGADDRVRVLENTRFDPRETANDPELAKELAAQADLYVNDAFGSAHRAHASTEGVAHLLPAYAGLLLERELAGAREAARESRSGRSSRSSAAPRSRTRSASCAASPSVPTSSSSAARWPRRSGPTRSTCR